MLFRLFNNNVHSITTMRLNKFLNYFFLLKHIFLKDGNISLNDKIFIDHKTLLGTTLSKAKNTI